jgi:2-iminobutanoate/2-iminopropanoate deaminase
MKHILLLFLLINISHQIMSQSTPPPYSKALKAGPFLFISGTLGRDDKGVLINENITAETNQLMKNIGKTLAEHGLSHDDLVSVTIYLTDMKNYDEVNKAYATFFKSKYPTRTCIAVKELPFNGNIEITSTALLK